LRSGLFAIGALILILGSLIVADDQPKVSAVKSIFGGWAMLSPEYQGLVQELMFGYALAMIGIIIMGSAVIPSKKSSMFICGICNLAFSSEAELYNHNNSKEHLEKASQLSKEEVEKREITKEEKISTKRKLRNSPVLQGVLIGIVSFVIFWGIFGLTFSQGFTMTSNGLSPDVNEGDLMLYEKIPFNEIKEGDIIAFVSPEPEKFAAKIGIVRNVFQNPNFVQTSNNENPNQMDRVDENEFVGKITNIVSDGGSIRQIYSFPYPILITGILLASPIIILSVRKR